MGAVSLLRTFTMPQNSGSKWAQAKAHLTAPLSTVILAR
jgi:hypothetical protein